MEKEQKNKNVIGEYILEIKYRVFNNPNFWLIDIKPIYSIC